jgi:hypothetical protein
MTVDLDDPRVSARQKSGRLTPVFGWLSLEEEEKSIERQVIRDRKLEYNSDVVYEQVNRDRPETR